MNSHTQLASEALGWRRCRRQTAINRLEASSECSYARFALGAAFLSAVTARFGLWQGTFDPKHFAKIPG